MFVSEDWRKYERVYMMIDPSGQGTDETVWITVGTLSGRFFVLDIQGSTDGYSEQTLERITQTAREYKVNEIVFEDNFGSGMFGVILGQHMKLKYPVGITPRKAKGQKELRILDTLEPLLRAHKLVIDHGAATKDIRDTTEDRSYSLFHQLTHVTRERGCQDTTIDSDCSAHAIAHVQDVAGVNSEEALQIAQHEQKAKAIDDLLAYSMSFSFEKPGTIPNNYQHKVDLLELSRPKLFFNNRKKR